MFWDRIKKHRPADADSRAFLLGFALLLPLYLGPLFVARYLPGLDLPFHLSLADMLIKDGKPDSPYSAFYQGKFPLVPYGAHYLALRVLSWFVRLMTAHKIIIGVYVAAMPLSAAALLRACGRIQIPALLAFPLAYNLTLHYGFVSFALSLPVVLLLLGQITRLLLDEKVGWPRFAGAAASAVLLFLCHLQNYLYGICAACTFIVFSRARLSRRALAALALVPSVAALAHWHLTSSFEGDTTGQRKSFAFGFEALKRQLVGELGNRKWIDEVHSRLNFLPVHLLRGFTDEVDQVASRSILICMLTFIVLGAVGAFMPKVPGPRPSMRVAGFFVCLGAAAAYFGLPHHLPALELMTFAPRFSVLLVLTSVLLVPAGLRRFTGPMRYAALLPATLVCGIYGAELVRHYRHFDREVADFAAVVRKAKPGKKAIGLVFDRYSRVMRNESTFVGLANLYPVLRPGPGSMVPLAYCGMRHMPCTRLEALSSMPDPGVWAPSLFKGEKAIEFFDYFFVRSPPPNVPIFGTAITKVDLVAKEGTWLLYQRKPGVGAPPPPARK